MEEVKTRSKQDLSWILFRFVSFGSLQCRTNQLPFFSCGRPGRRRRSKFKPVAAVQLCSFIRAVRHTAAQRSSARDADGKCPRRKTLISFKRHGHHDLANPIIFQVFQSSPSYPETFFFPGWTSTSTEIHFHFAVKSSLNMGLTVYAAAAFSDEVARGRDPGGRCDAMAV